MKLATPAQPIERAKGSPAAPCPAGAMVCAWRMLTRTQVHQWTVNGETFSDEWLAYQRAQYLTDTQKRAHHVSYYLNGHKTPASL